MSNADPEESEASDHKLPRTKARRRSNKNRNEWTAADAAERRKPVIAIIILALVLLAGIALIIYEFAKPSS